MSNAPQWVSFSVFADEEQKQHEYMQRPETTCWYCGENVCYLTHKYSPREKAQRPDEDPYKSKS